MAKFEVGNRIKVLDKPNWPDGGYKIANWEGTIVEIVQDPAGFVLMKTDKTGYEMLFHEKELELLESRAKVEQNLDHDGTLGFINALQQKSKGKSVDVRLDI